MLKSKGLIALLAMGVLALAATEAPAGTIVKSKSNITNNRSTSSDTTTTLAPTSGTTGATNNLQDRACRGDSAPACPSPQILQCHGGKWICVPPANASQ